MKRRIPIIIGLIVVLTFALAACGGSKGAQGGGSAASAGFTTIKDGTLTVGLEGGYPPMEYMDTDGTTLIGFDIDVANQIGKLLGLKVEFVNTAWDGIFAGLDKGQYDCIISSVSITPERQTNYLLTDPYVSNRLCIVVNAKNPSGVTSPDNFSGHTIAVQVSTTAGDAVDKLIADGAKDITVNRYEKVTQCFDDLKLGRVDAVYVDSVVASYYTKDDSATYNRIWINDVGEPMGICMKKGNDQLGAAIEAAVNTMYYDGTMKQLATKDFGDDFTSGLRDVKAKPTIPPYAGQNS